MSRESIVELRNVAAAENASRPTNGFKEDTLSSLEKFHDPDVQAKFIVEQLLSKVGFEQMADQEKISELDRLLAVFWQRYFSAMNAENDELNKIKFNSYYLLEAVAKIKSDLEQLQKQDKANLKSFFVSQGVN